MFAQAFKIARKFTRPVIISSRRFDGAVECGIGSMVILNKSGWILSAAHILDSSIAFQRHKKEIVIYNEQKQLLENNQSLGAKQKKRQLGALKPNQKWITNHSFWLGMDGITIAEAHFIKEADLLVARIEPFSPDWVDQYPVIKDPKDLPNGTSLCKLGFPFHSVSATFDENGSNFILAPGTTPVPLFPIEGIFTREIITTNTLNNQQPIKFIETSSPGLMGQSGGPIFDKHGTLWGIQSHTNTVDLGFKPTIKRNGREEVINQFLNVGVGVHPEVIVSYLTDLGVEFELSAY